MVYKTKISPRVIWLESDLTSTAPRVRANGKTGSYGYLGGSPCNFGGIPTQTSCTATPLSDGYDEITTYCYNNIIISNRYRHSAYVACNYVQ
jgi:hypothetical protein